MTHTSRRSAARATLVGNAATVGVTVAQAFLLVPLCLVHLGPTLYGAWLGASELLVWVPLLDAGVTNLLTQRIGAALGRDDYGDAARWSSTGLTALVLVGAALLAAGLLASPLVATWARVPQADAEGFVESFRIGAAGSTLLLLSNGVVGVSRGVQRTALVNAIQVAAAVAGLIVAMTLLVAGWGLWALGLGHFARGLTSFGGSLVFLATLPAAAGSWWRHPTKARALEMLTLAPSMAGASVGYAVANNSEILFVTTLFGPVPALTYALTRRAFDGVRSLLDTFAWAVAGGFSHLVTAADRHRARALLDEILWLRLATACLAAAVVLAVNRTFVSLLFGPEHYGGFGLTLAFAVQMIIGGQAFLANFLLRAIGQVREGSWLLAADAVARIAAIAGGLAVAGLAGAPWLSALVSAIALVVLGRRLEASLPEGREASASPPRATVPLLVVAIGFAAAWLPVVPSWPGVAVMTTAVGLVGIGLLWLVHPPSVSRRASGAAPRAAGGDGDAPPAVAFIGTIVPDTPEFHTPAFNRAGQMFQEELLRGLSHAGLEPTGIFSIELLPAFPRTRRLAGRGGRVTLRSGDRVRLLPFLNIQPLKATTVGLAFFVALLGWAWSHRSRPRVMHVINLTMPPGVVVWLAARLTGSRVVVSVLDIWKPGALVPDSWRWRVDFALQRWLLPRLDGHSVVSPAIADDFLPGRRVCVLEGGVSPDWLGLPAARAVAADRPVFRLVLAGSLEPYNGFELAADAMQLLPEGFELVVAGTGTLTDHAARCAGGDARIIVRGLLPFDEVMALYATADLLLNLRLTHRYDTRYFFPSKLMEMLASGTPVLSTKTGLVESEYGHVAYLLHEETPLDSATTVTTIRTIPPAERWTQGARARAFVLREKSWILAGCQAGQLHPARRAPGVRSVAAPTPSASGAVLPSRRHNGPSGCGEPLWYTPPA